jgi:hypothetical protein
LSKGQVQRGWEIRGCGAAFLGIGVPKLYQWSFCGEGTRKGLAGYALGIFGQRFFQSELLVEKLKSNQLTVISFQ